MSEGGRGPNGPVSGDVPRIVGVGTVALDTAETPAGQAREVAGGSALYFAAAVSRWTPVSVVGVTGDDFPDEVLAELGRRGVDVTGVARFPHPTFRWHARYDAEGRREILSVHRGGIVSERPRVPEGLRDPHLLFLGSTDPDVQASVLVGAGRPTLVMLDTMLHWIRDRRDALEGLLPRVDVLLANEDEVALLGDADDEGRAAAALLRRGPTWVVVKRGGRGACAYAVGQRLEVPAAAVARVVDPTGAGDAFAGGMASVLATMPASRGEASREAGVRAVNEHVMGRGLERGVAMGALAVSAFSFDALLER